jgi:hypothetical protein
MTVIRVAQREYVTAVQTYVVQHEYEVVAEAVSFDVAEAHVELGGILVALDSDGDVYQVFDDRIGPTFAGLWEGCTFHLLVRRLEHGNN